MENKKIETKVEEKKIQLPCGRFCEEGYCGDCVFLDLSRPGSSGRTFYCRQQDKYKEPTESSKFMCSHFRHR